MEPNDFRRFGPKKNVLLLTALLALAGHAAETQPLASTNATGSLSLDWVIREVRQRNPALKAARANWEAMRARVPQARAWDDPRVGVDVERSRTTVFDTFTDNEWMVGQTVPVSGKNRLRGRAAIAEAAAAFEDWRRRELDVIARTHGAYYRYASATAQLELNRRNEEWFTKSVEAARAKAGQGTRTQADVLLGETELAKLLESRTDLERQITAAQSQLNVAMNRPAYAELPPPPPLTFEPLVLPRFRPPPSPHASEETQFSFDWPMFQQRMQSLASAHRPELLNARQRIEAARARRQMARRAWIPDPELRVEARQFNGAAKVFDEYDTGIFFNFPWVNRGKYKGAIAEAEKNVEAAEHASAAAEAELAGLVQDQAKRIENAQTHYQFLGEKVLPLAQQTLAAMQEAYNAGRASFLELLVAQRTVWESEAMLQQHLADYLSAISEMEALVGISVNTAPSAEPTR